MLDQVATLLRLATMEDHIFLLSHVMRCPAGIASWAGSYIQPVPPVYSSGDPSTCWGSVLLDHFVTMLAVVLQPVRSVCDDVGCGAAACQVSLCGHGYTACQVSL